MEYRNFKPIFLGIGDENEIRRMGYDPKLSELGLMEKSLKVLDDCTFGTNLPFPIEVLVELVGYLAGGSEYSEPYLEIAPKKGEMPPFEHYVPKEFLKKDNDIKFTFGIKENVQGKHVDSSEHYRIDFGDKFHYKIYHYPVFKKITPLTKIKYKLYSYLKWLRKK